MTFHIFIQQEEVQKVTRKTWMGPQNQFYGRSPKGTKCKSLYNNTEGGRSFESIVGWTTQGKTNSGIEITIYGTLFLYFKEGWFITIGLGL